MSTIAIIDYGIGNVRSIYNAFKAIGESTVLTSDHNVIARSSGLVLPGVGAFAAGMENLEKRNLMAAIKGFANSGRPIIAICLGMQILFDESEEFGVSSGLGLIPGSVVRIPVLTDMGKLPHIGWDEITKPMSCKWEDTILSHTEDGSEVYFVHSYCAQPSNHKHILTETSYAGIKFCSSVKSGNIYGFQFHPEKSGPDGLKILQQFAQLCFR